MALNHCGTNTIETKRLTLRRFGLADARDVFNNWANDDEVTQYLSWKAHESPDVTKKVLAEWTESYCQGRFYNWAIVLKGYDRPIGSIGVIDINDNDMRGEAGYCIGKAYWGKGIMTEALKAVINYMFFEVGLNRIQAKHNTRNPASGRVMVKCGMQYEGTMRRFTVANNGEYADMMLYSILRSDHR